MRSAIRFCGDKNLSISKAGSGKKRKRFSLIEGESINGRRLSRLFTFFFGQAKRAAFLDFCSRKNGIGDPDEREKEDRKE